MTQHLVPVPRHYKCLWMGIIMTYKIHHGLVGIPNDNISLDPIKLTKEPFYHWTLLHVTNILTFKTLGY